VVRQLVDQTPAHPSAHQRIPREKSGPRIALGKEGPLKNNATDAQRLWSLPADDLKSTTPIRARDLIVECFVQAQQETFARGAALLGRVRPSDDDLRRSVSTAVRGVFRDTGASWDAPTTEDLGRVVQALGQRSNAWGTPEEIVRHHHGQITQLLAACRAVR
jgi:hypothetical protein